MSLGVALRLNSLKSFQSRSRNSSYAGAVCFCMVLAIGGAVSVSYAARPETSRGRGPASMPPEAGVGGTLLAPIDVSQAGRRESPPHTSNSDITATAGRTTSESLSREYIETRWTEQKGLPQNSVNAILQTRDGYLWLGTFGGLARFDGVNFTVYNSANTPGMKANRILSLYEDRAGVLWIGTETGQLMSLKDHHFRTFDTSDGLPGGLVWCFCEDHDDVMWIGTTKGLTRWQPGNVKTYTKKDGLAGDIVWSIYEDRPGHLWLGTEEGLTEFSNGRGQRREPGGGVRVVSTAGNGALWVGGEVGLAYLDDGRLTRYPRAEGPAKQFVRAMAVDHAGNVWAGYFDTGVVSRWDIGQTNKTPPSGSAGTITLASGGVRAICVDSEGDIWVGCQGGGLVRLKRRRITTYSSEDGLPNDGVQAVTDDGAGGVWTTTSTGLAHISGGPDHKITSYMQPEGFNAIYRDGDGVLWVGAAGLLKFDKGVASTYSTAQGLSNITILAIARDRSGDLWAGTESGLNEFRDGRFVAYHNTGGPLSDDVRFILPARDGGLWLGTVGGLSHFRNGVFTNYTTEEGLSNNYVRSVLEDDDGALWIGTYGGGLDRFKDGRFVHFTTKDGLFDPFISQIIDDGKGRLWMLSNHGIFYVRREELNDFADGRAASITCISFGVADGMKSSEGNGGSQPAGWKAPDGKLWFATIKGLVSVDPSPSPALLPPAVIEDVILDREPQPAGRSVRILPGKEDLEIHYTGLSFARPDQIRFKYRLIGLDKNWIDAGTRRAAYYSHIPPGDYTFSVMAASSDGVWNPSAATLRVVVAPPFWRTWWFLSLVVAGAAGLLATAYWRRVEYLKRARAVQEEFSRKLLESQEKERQRIAAELHDGLGQTLLIIKNRAFLASNALNQPDGNKETKDQLEEITGSASRAIEEVREIAFNLRPYQLNRFGLTRTLKAIFTRFSDSGRTVFSAEVDPIDGLFTKEDEISIYRIVQEGINNIVKHSHSTEAVLTVKRTGNEVEFVMRDNGCGFDPVLLASSQGAKPGFGLTGMAERVRMLGGAYRVNSAPGQGTTITIKLNVADTGNAN